MWQITWLSKLLSTYFTKHLNWHRGSIIDWARTIATTSGILLIILAFRFVLGYHYVSSLSAKAHIPTLRSYQQLELPTFQHLPWQCMRGDPTHVSNIPTRYRTMRPVLRSFCSKRYPPSHRRSRSACCRSNQWKQPHPQCKQVCLGLY